MSEADREALELRAEATRGRLLRNIDLLERRKRAVLKTVQRVGSFWAPLAAGAVAVVIAGAVLAITVQRVAAHRKRRRSLLRGWSMAREPVPSTSRPLTVTSEVGRKLLSTAVSIAAAPLLRWGLSRLLPPPLPVEDAPLA